MEAAEGVLDELALPRVHGGSCVAQRREPAGDAGRRRRRPGTGGAVALFADSGPPVESRSQRLVRHAASMAGADTLTGLSGQVLSAAFDHSGYDSACLVVGDRVLAAQGPAAPALRSLRHDELAPALAWVATGSSSQTSGHPTASCTPVHRSLSAPRSRTRPPAWSTPCDDVLLTSRRRVVA